MALSKEVKAEIIAKYRGHETDTASPAVQIALMTQRLVTLGEHFKVNKKDHHSRHGLMKIVGKRRRLLSYLRSSNLEAYKSLIQDLGIRR